MIITKIGFSQSNQYDTICRNFLVQDLELCLIMSSYDAIQLQNFSAVFSWQSDVKWIPAQCPHFGSGTRHTDLTCPKRWLRLLLFFSSSPPHLPPPHPQLCGSIVVHAEGSSVKLRSSHNFGRTAVLLVITTAPWLELRVIPPPLMCTSPEYGTVS